MRASALRLRSLALAKAGPIVVEAARPLSDEALQVLAEAFGSAAGEPQVRVVPALIGGVRVGTSAGLVDGSIAGMAEQAERELAARLEREEVAHG